MNGTPHRLVALFAGAALFSATAGTAEATEPRPGDREGTRFVTQTDETDDETENEDEPGAPPLEIGDRDQLVEWWQDRLNDWLRLSGSDSYPIVVDGWFGPQTEAATIEFQESVEDLDATGVVDPVDRVALRDAIEELEEGQGAPPLEIGDRDQLVEWWQDRLNDWLRLSGSDSYPIVVDGWFGPQTEAATIEFQESVEDLDATGVVDPVDRVALRDAIDALESDGADETPDVVEPIGTMSADTVSETGDVDGTALLESVDTGAHDGFERIVFRFAEGDDVGYRVGYTDTVPTDIAGEAVEVDGAAMLEVALPQTTGVDLTGPEPDVVYTGPDRFTVDELDVVREIAIVSDQHGAMSWVIGTSSEAPFAVGSLDDPFRLVIDIAITN